MAKIHRAVIPAAGRGTRMQPFSLCVPKELAPIGSTPALHFVLAEAERACLTEVAIVVSEAKSLLEDYVRCVQERGQLGGIGVHFVPQPEPLGLADAIDCCRDFCSGESFAVLLPDNLPLHPEYQLSRLLDAAMANDKHVLGVLELEHQHSGLFGNCGVIDYETRADGCLDIVKLGDKGPGRIAVPEQGRLLRNCGRYVFQAEIFEEIDRVRPTVKGEFDEVPVVQQLVARRRVLGVPIPMPLFDVGHAPGMLAASAWLNNA
jgi:UTP--glucose-1-phosphate uridylyltransferase